jgi:carbon storage regulator
MLVLSRKVGESIIIGANIRITITAIRGRQARIAIDAPEHLTIIRDELLPVTGTALAKSALPRRPS